MAWEATDETVAVSGGAGPSGWEEEKPRTWLDTAKSALRGIAPTQIVRTADDAVRAASNVFGIGDRLAGYMSGTGTAEQVRLSEEARKRSPIASVVGDFGGAAALPGIGGRQLAVRYGSGPLARAFGYGAEGAAIGAAQGAGQTFTGIPEDYARNAMMGGVLGGVFGGAGGAVFGARPAVSTAARTSLDDVGTAKTGAYKILERNPAGYDRDFIAGTANQLDAGPLFSYYTKTDIPTTQAALERMRNMPRQFVAPAELEAVRQGFSKIPKERTTDIAAGQHVKAAIDDFYANPPAGAVRPGTERAAALASQHSQQARDLAAAEFRMQKMADMRTAAENQAATSYSGLNVENNIRNQIKNFVNPNTGGRGRLAGYTPEEQAALNNIIHRGTLANVGRWTGNVLAGGGGVAVPVTLMAGSEYFKDNPAMAAVAPAAGLALRTLSNRGARANITAAENLIGQRNPLYQAHAATAPMAVPNAVSSDAAARARNAITLELINRQTEQQGP